MLQNTCKTLGFKKNMVYKIPPGGEVNHIQPVAYILLFDTIFRHFALLVTEISRQVQNFRIIPRILFTLCVGRFLKYT